MRRELAISFAFLILCVATLAPKLSGLASSTEPDLNRLHADLRGMLAARSYAVGMIDRKYILDHVVASRGACRLAVTLTRPGGSDHALFARLQRGKGRMWYFYRGAWSRDYPRLRPILDAFVQRTSRQLGQVYTYPPVLMIVASQPCDLAALPWDGLRVYPLD